MVNVRKSILINGKKYLCFTTGNNEVINFQSNKFNIYSNKLLVNIVSQLNLVYF
jgi:ubiquinone/menaquinone biosynthesis C-methylase UbiE